MKKIITLLFVLMVCTGNAMALDITLPNATPETPSSEASASDIGKMAVGTLAKKAASAVVASLPESISEIAKLTGFDLNTASIRELMKLPGIGEKKAQAIDKYRKEKGSFNTLDELLDVKGIGEKTLEKITKYLLSLLASSPEK